ncbi:MAG: GatB/YqeY domain-containing protein [Caldisericia bacterium]|nr:GatB/YqeY domain-containing protein [Caldisericia bacterium]MDD4614761.1 GatB/YqeY domain-containing protein [Caldisericia bacterium]
MLKDRIKDDFMKAYKAKDTLKAETLKMIKSAIQYKEVELKTANKDLSDQDVIDILKMELKKHKESIAQYIHANRVDSAQKEENEMSIIQEYLPKTMSFEEVYGAVQTLFENIEDKAISFGMMMKEAVSVLKDKADSSDIKKAVDQVIEDFNKAKK